VGTPVYMAPEILNNSNNDIDGYDDKCDVYSFGIMMLELVTNEAPFKECQNVFEIINKKEQFKHPSSLLKVSDMATFHLIAKCLVPDPEKRPTCTELLKSEFFHKAEDSDKLIAVSKENVHNDQDV